MQIERMPPGQTAPRESDCIKITQLGEGRFALATSALMQCDGEEAVSEAIIASDDYDSYAAAEAAGLAWAENCCVEKIYIETA